MDSASRRLVSIATVLSMCWLAGMRDAQAGPPLVVDDPETLDRGQVELFTSILYTKQGAANSYGTPTELTIGLAKGWECSMNGAYQYLTDPSSTPQTVNGLLSLEVGTKFRLLTESPTTPISLAISGKARFPTSADSKYAAQGKTSGGGFLILSKAFGDFSINGNVGYDAGVLQSQKVARDAWFFGFSAQRIFAKKYTVFAEVYSFAQVGRFGETVINADGGLLWDLTDRYRISVLLGRGFRPGGADFIGNIGFLLSLGSAAPAAKQAK